MSDIIFKKNKFKYLFIALLLLVIIIFTGYISTLFIFHPSEYIYWLMPNKLVVFLTGILGALASLVLLYIMIKSVFNKNFYIRINQEGLYLGIIQYSNKLIYWKDWDYIFYQSGTDFILQVYIGGMSDMWQKMKLNKAQIDEFKKNGNIKIDKIGRAHV